MTKVLDCSIIQTKWLFSHSNWLLNGDDNMGKCLECGKEVLRLNNRRNNRDNGKVICIDCKRKLREIQIKNLKNVG